MTSTHFTRLAALACCVFTVGCGTPRTWSAWTAETAAFTAVPRAVQVSDDALAPTELPLALDTAYGDGALPGPGFGLEARNPGYPETFIDTVHVDLTGPDHDVWVEWTGPGADDAPRGPWMSVAGTGRPGVNCDDVVTSNTTDTYCTPKGLFAVAGFADHLKGVTDCHYVTWIHFPRAIALHSHWELPDHPASHGCIRLPYAVAKLIHNNARAGMTTVHVGGTWTQPPTQLNDDLTGAFDE